MLSRRIAVLVAFLPGTLFAADAKGPDAEAVNAAEKKVEAFLATLKAPPGRQAVIMNEHVAGLFPKHVFVALIYPQFPIARQAPEGLKSANVFAVPTGEGKVVPITEAKELETLFRANLPAVTPKTAKAVVSSWLRLSQELSQDGFFKFAEIKTADNPASVEMLQGSVGVNEQNGDKGNITVKMQFNKEGKLMKVEHTVNLSAGARPRCQSTKLLDPDPIVRGMAEDTIRIMGRACFPYLDEQRAKASPELQKAIDRMKEIIIREGR